MALRKEGEKAYEYRRGQSQRDESTNADSDVGQAILQTASSSLEQIGLQNPIID
jgi:hypothetical protein